jgi:hypothetical protein
MSGASGASILSNGTSRVTNNKSVRFAPQGGPDQPFFDRITGQSKSDMPIPIPPPNPIKKKIDALQVLSNEAFVDDKDMPEDLAKNLYPQFSPNASTAENLPTLSKAWKRKERESFLNSCMSDRVKAILNRKFGKPNINQCFKSEGTFRHVVIPLFRTGHLDIDSPSDRQACIAFDLSTSDFFALYDEYKDVDFNCLRTSPVRMDIDAPTELDSDRMRCLTAALIFFEGDASALVRWMGGLHVSSYRSTDDVLGFLQGIVDDDVHKELTRIWNYGIPKYCNAEASEANFQAYRAFGNHSTVDHDPEKLYKTLLKDAALEQVLIFDERMIPFLLNCHLTPLGLVNIDVLGKKPRPVFDSTTRPTFWAFAINDMTNKKNEPDILEKNTEIRFMQWLWLMRALYPEREIYPMDDDGVAAYRQMKNHPDLVAMHTCTQCGFGVMATGGTFGDCANPSNYDVISRARRQLAQWLWVHDKNVIERVKHLLPEVSVAPRPSPTEIASFMPAEFDSLNPPPLDAQGNRLPPPYSHQVDDNLYAEIEDNLQKTLSCSALSLYIIMGFPGPFMPDLYSKEKLDSFYQPVRAVMGRQYFTRSMEVGLLDKKRDILIQIIPEWLKPKATYSLKEAASLLGKLQNATQYVRWAKVWLCPLYNEFSRALTVAYEITKRRWDNNPRLAAKYEAMSKMIPKDVNTRLRGIIAREKAAFLWRTSHRVAVSDHLKRSLTIILQYLRDASNPWREYIGFIIPRDPHIRTCGDASALAGGAYCNKLGFWFMIIWDKTTRLRASASVKDPTRLQINCLEFVVVLLQLAAVIVWMETMPRDIILKVFPSGLPALPIMDTGCDNCVSEGWTNKCWTRSHEGQLLLVIYSSIIQAWRVKQEVYHVPGMDNDAADHISRPYCASPSDPILSDPILLQQQMFQRHSFLKSYMSFQPSAELLQRISSALYCNSRLEVQKPPKTLGQFVPAGSTTSCTHM